MSEVGYGGHPPEDVQAGLDISRCILADLNTMRANAWVYWQVEALLTPHPKIVHATQDQILSLLMHQKSST